MLTVAEQFLVEAIQNLKKRGSKRPAKLIALRNALMGSLSLPTPEVMDALLQKLQADGHVVVEGAKVVYPKL